MAAVTSDWMPNVSSQEFPLFVSAIATAAICLYSFAMWLLIGRDPSPGRIVVLYDPPEGLSPAAIRYLLKNGLDEKGFTVNLIDIASKGFWTIERQGNHYLLSQGDANITCLTQDERALAMELLKEGSSLELGSENHERIYTAIRAMKRELDITFEGIYFQTHKPFLIPGASLSGLLLIYLALATFKKSALEAFFLMSVSLIWVLIFLILLLVTFHALRNLHWLTGRPGLPIPLARQSTFFCILAGTVGAALLWWLGNATAPWVPLVELVHGALLLIAYVVLKARTKAGRLLLDKVEGFRRFIATVEADRLNVLNSPDKNPRLFERFFPYAFALDAEEKWASQFGDVVTTSAVGEFAATDQTMNSWASLDLSSFGLFIQRWFPFKLGKVSIEVGPAEDI